LIIEVESTILRTEYRITAAIPLDLFLVADEMMCR